MKEDFEIRPLRQEESGILELLLYEAVFVPGGEAPVDRAVLNRPELSHYIEGFGSRPGDCCFVAAGKKAFAGGVWVRQFAQEEAGYGFFDGETPELAMALFPPYRGCGIGTRLLVQMLRELEHRGYPRVSLSVDRRNPAVRLYERMGFYVVRAGETDLTMLCRLNKGIT